MDEVVGSVYVSRDYDKFKFFDENREVTKARANKIRKSMEINGIIVNPILVNEDFEVIDGQGRLTALRELGAPIHYIKLSGVGAHECRALNSTATNWSTLDHIKSHAKSGNMSFQRLVQLLEEFPDIPVTNCLRFLAYFNATAKLQPYVEYGSGRGCSQSDSIRRGNILLTDSLYMAIKPFLAECCRVVNAVEAKGFAGNKTTLYRCVAFCILKCNCDVDRLVSNLEKYGNNYRFNLTTMPSTLEELTKVYNYNRSKKQCVYFDYLYKTLE